ncbi:hypothetical protein AMJ87_09785 [candidate division WOR_3 bacterium SM23_60]|uniref:DUF554 domain-containing protein n=1 Tax=candidate division WOR_3 bacterium SM23_60 TaxID=1703780 RepID=A0A0S8GCB4_UNCW3|nr:MAG: hypothetical protein AMJ87_09785 [candidate division WOR_3 bacterium SM23_60]
MIGVFANTVLVVVGSLLGLILRRGIPQNIKKIIMTGLGLFTCVLGIKMGLEMGRALVVVLSLVTGGVLGELFRIENFLEGIATKLKVVVKARSDTSFAQAFVTASLLFCVGPMTILGSLQAGLENNPELLFVKSLMDGVSAVILCSTIGIGVIFSALVVLLYQGFLVLLAQQLQFLMNPLYLNDFTSVGGILVFAIGLKLLDIKQIKVANFLPALVLVLLFAFLFR